MPIKKEIPYRDKLILVFYVNVANMEPADIPAFIKSTKENVMPGKIDESVVHYFVPVRGRESEVVCLNPQLYAPGEMKKEQSRRLREVTKRLNRLDDIQNDKRRKVLTETNG